MTISKSALAVVFAAGAILAAPLASADEATTQTIGEAGELVNGPVVQTWTITGLQPSSDVIPHAVAGTLWEATATNEAVAGSVAPIVSNLNARAADGQTYRALFQVATAQGVNPSILAQGEKTTGKVYFDVTGPSPDSVVYNSGGDDLLVWVKPAPTASRPSGSTPGTRPAAPSADTPAATPDPAEGRAGTPVAQGTGAEGEVPTGSQGTPITESTEGAPGAETTPGTEAAEEPQGSEAPQGVEGTEDGAQTPTPAPAPAGSQGTPIIEGDGAQPAPVATGTPHGPQPAVAPSTVAPAPVPHGTPSS